MHNTGALERKGSNDLSNVSGRRGPKPRPALVCDVTEREDGVAVTVAYGTSQKLNRLHAGEFAITRQDQPAAYACAGLSFDTKFDLGQLVELPWSQTFFAVPVHAPFWATAQAGQPACVDDANGAGGLPVCAQRWLKAESLVETDPLPPLSKREGLFGFTSQ